MELLANKHILLGVSGGIAAYKSADLVRRLREQGAEVRVVMTRAATEFVGPLTFQAVSANPVHTALLDPEAEAGMGHIELARWADLVLVAPASADLIARLAVGLADDLLTTLCLACDARRALAPAMNRLMWANPATAANVATLAARGWAVFGPGEGDQACGEFGAGRMLEPLELAALAAGVFADGGALSGRRVLVTAGPTREALDPVRYISNRSSGKMGFAIADAACRAGAAVSLVAGPSVLATPPGVARIDVETAAEMHAAVLARVEACDIFIATAAVSDYRPAEARAHKIKKDAGELSLRLTRNPDILAEVAALPGAPFTVGFAAETEQLEAHAREKLRQKKLDMIAANLVGPDRGFDAEHNELEVFWPGGQARIERAPKPQVAQRLLALIAERCAPAG